MDAAVAARLVEVNLPAYDLDIGAVIDLRRSSEVLEHWRSGLSEALADLDQLPSTVRDRAAREEIERALAAHAQRFTGNAAGEFSRFSPLRKAAKTIEFGVAGGLAGAAVAGSLLGGVLSAAASGAARAALEATQDRESTADQRAALRAARDHALILSGWTP